MSEAMHVKGYKQPKHLILWKAKNINTLQFTRQFHNYTYDWLCHLVASSYQVTKPIVILYAYSYFVFIILGARGCQGHIVTV